jgi:hypothetical protein
VHDARPRANILDISVGARPLSLVDQIPQMRGRLKRVQPAAEPARDCTAVYGIAKPGSRVNNSCGSATRSGRPRRGGRTRSSSWQLAGCSPTSRLDSTRQFTDETRSHRNGHRLGRRVAAHAHALPASIPKEPPFTAESGGATQGRAVGDESASRNRKFESTPLQERVTCELGPSRSGAVTRPHFHQADQFQVVVAGRGRLGDHEFSDAEREAQG